MLGDIRTHSHLYRKGTCLFCLQVEVTTTKNVFWWNKTNIFKGATNWCHLKKKTQSLKSREKNNNLKTIIFTIDNCYVIQQLRHFNPFFSKEKPFYIVKFSSSKFTPVKLWFKSLEYSSIYNSKMKRMETLLLVQC